ncbi:hypothetical protein [Myxococcus stipitatus]
MNLIDKLAGRETKGNENISIVAEKILPEEVLGRPRRDTCD